MTPEELAQVHAQCFAHAAWDAAAFAALLSRPATRLLVSGPAFLLAQIIPPEAEILTLAVPPSQRRQGHARALIAQLRADPAVRSLHLEVAADNTAAIALYQEAGFVQTATRKAYYARSDAPKSDALIFTAPA